MLDCAFSIAFEFHLLAEVSLKFKILIVGERGLKETVEQCKLRATAGAREIKLGRRL